MVHFPTFLAFVVGSMEVIQPVAGNLAGLSARINLGPANMAFQRRQTTSPPVPAQCASLCDPVAGIISSGQCTPSQCCLATFENSFFDCFTCVASFADLTDYTAPQSTIDALYDECARLGFQLPVLTFPGQNANRTLSPVLQSQTTISVLSSLSIPYTPAQTTISPSTTTSLQATTASSTPKPTSSSSGIRSVETGCFHLIASAMMLGTWLCFVVY